MPLIKSKPQLDGRTNRSVKFATVSNVWANQLEAFDARDLLNIGGKLSSLVNQP